MKFNLQRLATYPAPIRLGIFVLSLLVLWVPVAAPLSFLLRGDANLATIVTMGLLAILFLVSVPKWGKWVYGESQIYARYGLHWNRRHGAALVQGLSVGLCFVWGLFALMALLGWVKLQASPPVSRVVVEGLASALGIGFAEELFFRGWLLDELERDYSPRISLGGDALIFAMLHFIKPVGEMLRTFPQFPGLILLGMALVLAKRSRRNNLGVAIGLHAGLLWGYYILDVGKLVDYTHAVAPWVTGINGNPLAGLMGLLGLSVLALGYFRANRLHNY